jgi:hypothetical protein
MDHGDEEIIMVDRCYGDGDHHVIMGHTVSLCEYVSCCFTPTCDNGRSRTIPHKL